MLLSCKLCNNLQILIQKRWTFSDSANKVFLLINPCIFPFWVYINIANANWWYLSNFSWMQAVKPVVLHHYRQDISHLLIPNCAHYAIIQFLRYILADEAKTYTTKSNGWIKLNQFKTKHWIYYINLKWFNLIYSEQIHHQITRNALVLLFMDELITVAPVFFT